MLQVGDAAVDWLHCPAARLRTLLVEAFYAKRATIVARLCHDFAHLATGIDLAATRRAECRKWPEDRKAALRVVQAGGVVTQPIVCKWNGERLCPLCKCAV